MRTIAQDVERITRKWFKEAPPAVLLTHILDSQGIRVVTKQNGEDEYCLATRTIFVRMREPERLCRAWIRKRIHRVTGRPSTDPEFVRNWVREFLLPARLLEKHENFLKLQWLAIRKETEGWTGLVSNLAGFFRVSVGLVEEALMVRGFTRDGHQSVIALPIKGGGLKKIG